MSLTDTSPAARRPLWRRVLRWIPWLFVGSRRLAVNLLWLALLVGLGVWVFTPSPAALKDRTTLVLDLAGPIVEQQPGLSHESALAQLGMGAGSAVQLRDVVAGLDAAARDPKITQALLLLDDLGDAGLPTLREVSAALQRFKAAGKPVYAWGSGYDQRSLYLAAQADQVFMHPMGQVMLQGYGRPRNYYKDLLDKVGVTVHVLKVGTYKSFGEPFSRSAPSDAALAADKLLYDDLWRLWLAGVEQARRLPPGSVMAAIDALPGNLLAVGGDLARLSLDSRLVDGLKTRDEVQALLLEKGAPDPDADAKAGGLRQVRLVDYLPRLKPPGDGDGIGVVVAEGEISDGEAPAGSIGGLSTAALIRQAREDESVKAIVLRVRSPGGSAFGSELVRRELELARGAGKPVVVSMGDVAASGGYWISTAADEVIADEATVTGSIGVLAIVPTFERAMDKVGVSSHGYTTTWLGAALDPQQGLDPRAEQLLQASIDHAYRQFTGLVAQARNTSADKIDAVAQGRVWTGGQALQRGLVDRTGSLADALAAARARAKLPEDAPVRYLEREPGRFARLLEMAGRTAGVDTALARLLPLLGLSGVPALGAPAVAAAASPGLAADLGWLTGVAQHRRPFEALAHCLCLAP